MTFPFQQAIQNIFFEDMTDGALLVVDQNGKIIKTNGKTEEIFGQSPKALLGINYFELVKFKDLKGNPIPNTERPSYKALYEDQKQVQPFFCLLSTPQGDISVAVKAYTIKLPGHKRPVGLVTHIRKAKRQLDIKDMQTNFVSLAAHQLKTPAGVTKGFLELGLKDTLLERPEAENLRLQILKAYEANQSLIRAAKDLLNAAKLQGGVLQPEIRPADLDELLSSKQHAYGLWKQSKRVNFVIKKDFAGHASSHVHTDAQILAELIDIVLHNAFKFARMGGRVILAAKKTRRHFEILIEDDGPGLRPEAAPILPQHTADFLANNTGHGMGLKLARQYTLLLKGEMRTEEVKPHGARFILTLPDWK